MMRVRNAGIWRDDSGWTDAEYFHNGFALATGQPLLPALVFFLVHLGVLPKRLAFRLLRMMTRA